MVWRTARGPTTATSDTMVDNKVCAIHHGKETGSRSLPRFCGCPEGVWEAATPEGTTGECRLLCVLVVATEGPQSLCDIVNEAWATMYPTTVL